MNPDTDGRRVIVIDDHPLFRKGVAQLVAMDGELSLAGEASSGEEGVALAKQTNPDLVLLDLHMRGMSGIDTLRALRDAGIDARIVILTVSDNPDDLIAAIRAGADGYLLKDMEPEELLPRMKDVLAGRLVIGDKLSGLLAQALREEAAETSRRAAVLTAREKAILARLANGLSNKAIGRELDIAEGTVKVHMKSLLKKLGFRSRVELAIWAVEQRLAKE